MEKKFNMCPKGLFWLTLGLLIAGFIFIALGITLLFFYFNCCSCCLKLYWGSILSGLGIGFLAASNISFRMLKDMQSCLKKEFYQNIDK